MGSIGYVGVGKMGSRMAARLMAAGHDVTLWNRLDEFYEANVRPLADKGARIAESPREAAAGKDMCFTSVANGEAFNAVCTGPDGILAARPAPTVLVDVSTLGPWESEDIARQAEDSGIGFLRAPVSREHRRSRGRLPGYHGLWGTRGVRGGGPVS